MEHANVSLLTFPILIYIACSTTYGVGALECTQEFVTKCRAILTNPRELDVFAMADDDGAVVECVAAACTGTNLLYCGNEMDEFSYGGCHGSCKSCVETYNRFANPVGPAYSSPASPADYGYGNAKYCYDCFDGYHQVPLYDYDQIAATTWGHETDDSAVKLVAGVCERIIFMYAFTHFSSMWTRCT